ncbi:DUF1758 domain-containing protein [Trichonephila clavipes]|nr:DUF1758 domain-containing protein [Trichonephila clavipes]
MIPRQSPILAFSARTVIRARNVGMVEALPYEKRKPILMKGAFCFRCIKRYHKISNCKVKVQCSICNSKKHVDGMHCDEIKQFKQVKPESKEVTENTTLSNNSCAREVFLQTLIVHIKENSLKHFIRVIIDTGCQKSYITKYLAGKMKLKGLGEEIVNHGLFGEIERAEPHQRYLINLANVDGNYNCQLEVLDEKKICTSLPRMNDIRRLNQLKDIGGLIAVHTLLGWTVMDKSDVKGTSTNSSMLVLSLHVNEAKITDLWNLDTLSLKDCSENRSKTETQELALNYFRETLDQDSTGRYKVNLPWLEGHPPLPDNKELAQKRLKNTVKSLKLANRLNEYQEVFYQWEREGIIEPIHGENDIPENLDVHYLP